MLRAPADRCRIQTAQGANLDPAWACTSSLGAAYCTGMSRPGYIWVADADFPIELPLNQTVSRQPDSLVATSVRDTRARLLGHALA